MFFSQDNEFARNTHFTARSENRVFLKIQYFKNETFVRVETFRIFYGPWNLYMGRISGRNYVINMGENAFRFWDFIGILKSKKSAVSPLVFVLFSLLLSHSSSRKLRCISKQILYSESASKIESILPCFK